MFFRKKFIFITLILLIVLSSGFCLRSTKKKTNTEKGNCFSGVMEKPDLFEKCVFISHQNDTLPYRLMRPLVNDTTPTYPLVIFLHGAGERGRDNKMQLMNCAENFSSDSLRKAHPCFMLVPQCANGHRWVETDWKLPSHIMPDTPSVYLKLTMLLMDSLVKFLNIDTNRIYITGLSMGGFGTWDAISRWPEKFAAAVPVCGGGDTAKASLMKDLPIWAFHGDVDKVVLTSRSRNMIEAIKRSGGNPKYTEYKGIAHNSWTPTYTNPALFDWMFLQRKNVK